MRTASLAATLAVLTLGIAAACGERHPRPEAGVETGAAGNGQPAPTPGIRPGINAAALIGAASNPYTGNPRAVQDGRRLFNAYNCSGCHSGYAGGGMGPNLRDTVWIYGASDADLYSTITEGRPNGMPAWGGTIPEDQIWRIVAYLRTLGTKAEPEKPPTPTRTTMSVAERKEAT
jgi:cytochrome c oxidase cbb3-type subunit 3